MTLLIMTALAVLVGLTTMGALTWAYFAEDRACRKAQASRPVEQRTPEREHIGA